MAYYNISTIGKLKSICCNPDFCHIAPYTVHLCFTFSQALCLFLLCFQILNMFPG